MIIVKILTMLLPWPLRRWILNEFFGYEIHKTAKIGFSWVFPQKLTMGKGAQIGHLNVVINLDNFLMHDHSIIVRSNWITGFPSGTNSPHFAHQSDRRSLLILGAHAAVTKGHHIDCTNSVKIGAFSTLAGYRSQLLTHAIDVLENRQDSKGLEIGSFCFVGTSCIILGGSVLPDYCVLAAGSVINRAFSSRYKLYGGIPAREIKDLDKQSGYFIREVGFVN